MSDLEDSPLNFQEAHEILVNHIATLYAKLVLIHNDPEYLNPTARGYADTKKQIDQAEKDLIQFKEAWYIVKRLNDKNHD